MDSGQQFAAALTAYIVGFSICGMIALIVWGLFP